MVGVLIDMRAAVTRRQASGKRAAGLLLLAAFVTLLAAGTLLAGLRHYRYPGAGANVVATLCFGWLLGAVSGPLVTGDNAALRMDYFKLLPIPARKLAYAMLGAAFADVSLAFSLVAFGALVALGAQAGVAAALTGAAAMLLDLALAVVAGQVAIAVFGPVISSRRGRDFAAMTLALVITLLALASSLVPFVAARLTDGHSPALSALVRVLPSGWGAAAVDAASRSDWGLAVLALAGLAALIAALALAWPPLLARRLMMSAASARRSARRSAHGGRAGGHAVTGPVVAPVRAPAVAPVVAPAVARGILPATPLGAVLGRELRLYARSTLRSMLLMISFLVAVVTALIGAFSGKTTGLPFAGLPFAGLLFTLIAAACFTNFYGDDGTSLWLTLVVPGAARADVRGRVMAWLLAVGPAGLLLTVVLTAISGQAWSWPWVLAGEPALLIGCAGLLAAVGAWSVNAPAPDGGPSPMRVLKTHLALIALPAVVLFPAAALLIPGAVFPSPLLRWLAVPAALAWACYLSWRSVRWATRRLEERGPEIFAATRAPAA